MENELLKKFLVKKYGSEKLAESSKEWKAYKLIEDSIRDDEALCELANEECNATISAMKSIREEVMMKVEDPKERATIISLCARTQNEAFSKVQAMKNGLYELKTKYKEVMKEFEEKKTSDNLKSKSKETDNGFDWNSPSIKKKPRKRSTTTYTKEQFLPKTTDFI